MVYKTLLIIHVAAGTVALLTGIAAMILKKNPGKHATVGNIYYWGMIINGFSAVVMTTIKFNLFFLVIGVFSLYLVHTGKQTIRYWRRKQPWENTIADMLIIYIGLAAAVIMIIYPLIIMISAGRFFIPVLGVFGLILLINSIQDLVMLRKKDNRVPRNKRFLISHIGKMGGSYIAATTAFLVNNVNIDLMWVVWLMPTVAGSVLIAFAINKWKAKLQLP